MDNNKTDDDLEIYFRNKLQNYMINYQEKNWKKLKKRLDILQIREEQKN